jgi:sulfite exporter TauE/SafE
MCGPLAIGQSVHRLCALPCHAATNGACRRATMLGGYHLGRITTYAALGALAGFGGFGLQASFAPLGSALLLLAAACMLLAAVRPSTLGLPARRILPVLQKLHLAPGSFGFGLVMGLLPCGLLYTALLAASVTASAWRGAVSMACFGLATVPALALLTFAGQTRPASALLRRAAPAILAVNALILFAAAGWRTLL